MKKILILLLIPTLLLTGCAKAPTETVNLKFTDATSFETLKALDGKPVSIVGYMATLSPVGGNYIYLMNMPYQSCPFCVPNTTQLANTMAVYAKKGQSFDYTDQAVRVTGRMEIGDSTDDFGYEYNYRIADAQCETVDLGEISEEYALWQSIASDGIVADISAMLDYVYFVCCWPDYQMTYQDEAGNEVSYLLYPGDVEEILQDAGPDGYAAYAAEDYFPGLLSRIDAISDTGLSDLSAIVTDARALEKYARQELSGGRYLYDENADRYNLDNAQEMANRFDEIYTRFSLWLGKWEV